ncbi:Uncharacterized protein FWK35_00023214 [Aphis craccivora]|uniref:Helitron helicase-like domain-containing protein n=1 Tax=Aphis craccivora TaxID=307492 RepID=A0A6G0VY02_APHCR|nr:Uncharacterized protein FWK35_00023214 [Aphis craccivora]
MISLNFELISISLKVVNERSISHSNKITQPSDRHDLTARVFKLKLRKLIDLITKCKIFGNVTSWVYSIEWQKRGLQHAHISIWLENKVHPDRIDNIISAEFPDPEKDPHLFDILKKNMIHGPCGKLNPFSVCIKDGQCKCNYPRKLLDVTRSDKNGYPLYRRRSTTNGGFQTAINVKWIVPYCPLISKIMNAHINVELCSSVVAVKYILKYIHKGSDQAMFSIENKNNNEIEEYQSGRYINSNEAIWRIFGFKIHDRYPNVQHLHVHLENGQRVYFSNDNVSKKVEKPPETTLTAFFNRLFRENVIILRYPKIFYMKQFAKKFNLRKQGIRYSHEIFQSDTLGRMYTIHPSNSECFFFLRILLHNVIGPMSFGYLKTVNGITYKSYREACQQLGLLKDDKHWGDALAEANETKKSSSIRSLFSIIFTSCNPSDPKSLWEKYKKTMNYTDEIFNETLIIIEDMCLIISGKNLNQWNNSFFSNRKYIKRFRNHS